MAAGGVGDLITPQHLQARKVKKLKQQQHRMCFYFTCLELFVLVLCSAGVFLNFKYIQCTGFVSLFSGEGQPRFEADIGHYTTDHQCVPVYSTMTS